MAEGMENAVAIAIYQALAADATLTALLATGPAGGPAIYDAVPQPSDTGAASAFPYLVIGDDIVTAWDTDTSQGGDVLITIHIWSRKDTKRECKQIQAALFNVLARAELTVPDHEFIGIEFETSTCVQDPDMETQHGTSEFRMYIDQLGYGE